jgi:uncharacterized protein (TIGR03437 family)
VLGVGVAPRAEAQSQGTFTSTGNMAIPRYFQTATLLGDGRVLITGRRTADSLFFGDAPGYPGYFQVNFRMPSGVGPGSAVLVRLTYVGRPSNAVTIGVQ